MQISDQGLKVLDHLLHAKGMELYQLHRILPNPCLQQTLDTLGALEKSGLVHRTVRISVTKYELTQLGLNQLALVTNVRATALILPNEGLNAHLYGQP